MNERAIYDGLLASAFGLTLVTALYLCFFAAPYGRHTRAGYGPTLDNTLSWVLMEAPAALLPLVLVAMGGRYDLMTLVFVVIWEAHYLQRAFVYPWLIRGRGTRVPLLVPVSGALFNVLNGYLGFRFLTVLAPRYPPAWLWDPRFVLGVLLFALGYLINRRADRALRALRAPGETGYKIPQGGLYRLISCPNYFGELVEWCGWAVLTWSLPGLFFALFTAANLIPRALSHHRDYRRRFHDYPQERRAVIPYVL
jgi:3-oxo-5-alpha-steroid 4-dehydrogenase 1